MKNIYIKNCFLHLGCLWPCLFLVSFMTYNNNAFVLKIAFKTIVQGLIFQFIPFLIWLKSNVLQLQVTL